MSNALVFRDFKAQVVVDRKPLSIYCAEFDDATRTATCWIASEAGKEFRVRVKPLVMPPSDLGFGLRIDGCRAGGQLSHKRDPQGAKVFHGAKDGEFYRPFIFSKLEVGDDETVIIPKEGGIQLGTINVKVERVIRLEYAQRPLKAEGADLGNFVVNEKSKMLTCHATSLGDPRPGKGRRFTNVKSFDPKDSLPWVRFIFKYRSADILQAEGIIIRQPVPEVSKQEQSLSDDEEEALQVEEARLAALAEQVRSRREALAAKKRVKEEASDAGPSKKKVKVETEIEVIDLT